MKTLALLIAASCIFVVVPAYAGPCSKEIAMVTQLLSGGGSAPSLGSAASTVTSTGTLSGVAGGTSAGSTKRAVSPEALDAVDQAKKADAAGDEPTCMEYITKAKELLGLIQ